MMFVVCLPKTSLLFLADFVVHFCIPLKQFVQKSNGSTIANCSYVSFCANHHQKAHRTHTHSIRYRRDLASRVHPPPTNHPIITTHNHRSLARGPTLSITPSKAVADKLFARSVRRVILLLGRTMTWRAQGRDNADLVQQLHGSYLVLHIATQL